MFTPAPKEKRPELVRIVLLVAAVLVVVFGAVALRSYLHEKDKKPETITALDAYASSLPLSNIAMSQAEHGSIQSLYVDGQILNNGSRTVRNATVQVVFHGEDGSLVKLATQELPLIRIREPYVDLQPISADPIHPGEHKDFRLILDGVPDAWNQQPPEIRIIRTELQ